jgi:hypothetical protein
LAILPALSVHAAGKLHSVPLYSSCLFSPSPSCTKPAKVRLRAVQTVEQGGGIF